MAIVVVRMTALVSGRVQGVGFRHWVQQRAHAVGLVGAATNLPDGRVEVVAEGERSECEQLVAALRGAEAPGSVHAVDVTWGDPTDAFERFVTR